ncbi:TNT domain-containing protein [Mucilaginibacter aquaedulcis]|uniref:TNT domain-containing protein n=1 Tax=Mucilaginibacter aquaedulcis TaxID=1187081 RepID=UPI0025B292E2|nr:TNT domain-containing protein [Mucilaginibacter aquaedulcis]MDN3547483.1 TNT domain-containing protein [Mucilaginibacter aquaedulcis]
MKSIKVLLIAALFMPFLATAQQKNSAHHHSGNLKHHKSADGLVRGVSFDVFKSSVSDFADSTKKALADTAWALWRDEKWDGLEKFFTANNLNGGWPPNRGAVNLKIVVLKAGVLIDRYGGYFDADSVFQDKGTFVSLTDVPFPQRALPDKTLSSPYRVYKIVKPITNVKEGKIIPWFGKPGLGVQDELPYTVNDLKKEGYLEEQKKQESSK